MKKTPTHDRAALHFSQMRDLATTLGAVRAQVLRHEYSYEAFGSWSTMVRYKGRNYQFSFDGRDELYSVDAVSETDIPHGSHTLFQQTGRSGDIPIAGMVSAIEDNKPA